MRWGIPESPANIPASPSHAFGVGPSLSALKGGEGFHSAFFAKNLSVLGGEAFYPLAMLVMTPIAKGA